MNLSEHFTLEEMTISQTATRRGLNNAPGPAEVLALTMLCTRLLEPFRAKVGPIHVNSGFRSKEVNAAVGGVSTSQHCKGEAADIIVPGKTIEELFTILRESGLEFDQAIQEGTWLHLSFTMARPNRREMLRATFKNGKASYTKA